MSTLSTGPRSDEGKERSSLNATRHGLCSDRLVIPGEDAAEWETFRDSVVRRWLPADVRGQKSEVRGQRSAARGRSAAGARGGRAARATAGTGRGGAGRFVPYFRRRGCCGRYF